MADYVHSLGLKFGLCLLRRMHTQEERNQDAKPADFGLHFPPDCGSDFGSINVPRSRYTSVGVKTCHHGWSPGSFGHYQQDADLFASWGIDYVKMDWCGDNRTLDAQ